MWHDQLRNSGVDKVLFQSAFHRIMRMRDFSPAAQLAIYASFKDTRLDTLYQFDWTHGYRQSIPQLDTPIESISWEFIADIGQPRQLGCVRQQGRGPGLAMDLAGESPKAAYLTYLRSGRGLTHHLLVIDLQGEQPTIAYRGKAGQNTVAVLVQLETDGIEAFEPLQVIDLGPGAKKLEERIKSLRHD